MSSITMACPKMRPGPRRLLAMVLWLMVAVTPCSQMPPPPPLAEALPGLEVARLSAISELLIVPVAAPTRAVKYTPPPPAVPGVTLAAPSWAVLLTTLTRSRVSLEFPLWLISATPPPLPLPPVWPAPPVEVLPTTVAAVRERAADSTKKAPPKAEPPLPAGAAPPVAELLTAVTFERVPLLELMTATAPPRPSAVAPLLSSPLPLDAPATALLLVKVRLLPVTVAWSAWIAAPSASPPLVVPVPPWATFPEKVIFVKLTALAKRNSRAPPAPAPPAPPVLSPIALLFRKIMLLRVNGPEAVGWAAALIHSPAPKAK